MINFLQYLSHQLQRFLPGIKDDKDARTEMYECVESAIMEMDNIQKDIAFLKKEYADIKQGLDALLNPPKPKKEEPKTAMDRLTDSEIAFLMKDRDIEAVKKVQNRLQVDVKEAKRIVGEACIEIEKIMDESSYSYGKGNQQ